MQSFLHLLLEYYKNILCSIQIYLYSIFHNKYHSKLARRAKRLQTHSGCFFIQSNSVTRFIFSLSQVFRNPPASPHGPPDLL